MPKLTREDKVEIFNKLFIRKFGSERGAVSSAADYLGAWQGNVSNMLRGRASIPDKYLELLKAAPDLKIEDAGFMFDEDDANATNRLIKMPFDNKVGAKLELAMAWFTDDLSFDHFDENGKIDRAFLMKAMEGILDFSLQWMRQINPDRYFEMKAKFDSADEKPKPTGYMLPQWGLASTKNETEEDPLS